MIGSASAPVHSVAHRWRYALPDPVSYEAAVYDAELGLGTGGDWCGGPRREGALLSGVALAGRVMMHAHRPGDTQWNICSGVSRWSQYELFTPITRFSPVANSPICHAKSSVAALR